MKKWSLLILLVLASCSGSSNPAAVVEEYFRALVAKDATKAVTLSCAAWESGARTDVDTFAMYPAELQNIACQDAGVEGNAHRITCTGKAILDYNGEKQEIDLAGRDYTVVQEGGEWRMCGYQ
ncbi:MAG: hypothetical protein WBM17_15950 [Anaerolineales bacterium]